MQTDSTNAHVGTPDRTCANGNSSENLDVYHIKWINWCNEKTAIITQNINGPCPLLAIFNALLLSKRIQLADVLEMISSKQILDYIGGVVLEGMPSDLSDEVKLNYEQNMADAIAIFTKLQTGIDVNVQFKGVSSFECTSELAVFDLLRIPLYHGWLPDPQDVATFSVLKNLSYNQTVDKIITSKDSSDETLIQEGLIAEQFLNSTASQLTCHGVVKMLETMHELQLGVFFRNNHFATVYKKRNELFTLVTDQGFLNKSNIVWETLSNVQGDSHFTDADFLTTPLESPADTTVLDMTPEQQIDHDFQVALSLQERSDPDPPTTQQPPPSVNNEEEDHKIAARLQQQFDAEASTAAGSEARQSPPRRRNSPDRRDNSSDKCNIL